MSLAQAIRASLVAGLVVVPAFPAMAEIQWNGFMSVGAGMTLDDEETFAGYDDRLSFEPDSILGLQASADLGDKLSATGQLVGRGDSREIDVEWAYLSYQLRPDLRLNVGRQRLAFYYYSDYLDVGYAYHFLRPPTSVYTSALSSFDGVSALYNTFVGNNEAKVQLFAGSYKNNGVEYGTGEVDFEVNDYYGGVFSLVHDDWLTFRASYHEAQLTLEGEGVSALNDLVTAGRALGLERVANAFTLNRVDYAFAGLAVSADLNDYLFVAEAQQTDIRTTGREERGFYVSAGKRFGSVMPYVTFERAEATTDNALYEDIAVTSPIAVGVKAKLAAYMNDSDRNEHLYSVGVRYDFHPSAALKVEYTKVDDHRDESLAGVTSRDANLINFTVDAVF